MDKSISKTPLERKLGLKDDFKCLIINANSDYMAWLEDLKLLLDINEKSDGSGYDFIQLFSMQFSDLEKDFSGLKQYLKKDGMLWICWPKGSSNLQIDLNREGVRDYVLQSGLVDIKVASIDETWSGLKFVYRTSDRD